MAWLLHPGDPLPALLLAPRVQLSDFAGRYAILALGPGDALLGALRTLSRLGLPAQALPVVGIAPQPLLQGTDLPEGLRICSDVAGTTARRLGAEDGEAMVVLCDPRGAVVSAVADADLGRMLTAAVALARPLILA